MCSSDLNTAAGYDRAGDSYAITYVLGIDHAALNFGEVPLATLTSDGQQTALPGSVVVYAHTFNANSSGSVTFAGTSSAGYPLALLRDSNCNGLLDAGEPVLGGAVATSAGIPVCILLKVTVPAGAAFNAQDRATLVADFSYANASPALSANLVNTDLTTVGSAGAAGLVLLKSQDNATPTPGSTIGYSIVYTNNGSAAVGSIRITDGTPAFTTFLAATCVPPLPAGITACTLTRMPGVGATGAIEWTLTGSLLPGASGQVGFTVRLE